MPTIDNKLRTLDVAAYIAEDFEIPTETTASLDAGKWESIEYVMENPEEFGVEQIQNSVSIVKVTLANGQRFQGIFAEILDDEDDQILQLQLYGNTVPTDPDAPVIPDTEFVNL